MMPHGPAQFQDKLSGIQARLMVALCVVGGEDGLAYMVWWAARRREGGTTLIILTRICIALDHTLFEEPRTSKVDKETRHRENSFIVFPLWV